MATERIVISIKEDGSRVVRRNIEGIGQGAKTAEGAVSQLKRALIGLGAVLSVQKAVAYADAFTRIQNSLKIAGFESLRLAAATDRLLQIANSTRTQFEANALLFQRLGNSQKELGATSEQLFKVTEAVGQAIAIQGGSAEAARGALVQFSQAMASGTVRAEEFNSILEGALPLAQAAARGIDAAGGSVGRLRQLVLEGKVSSQEFFQAILEQAPSLAEQFSRSVPTVESALQVLDNSFTYTIGNIDQTIGVSRTLATFIIALANNMDDLAAAAFGVGTALAIAFAPRVIALIGTAVASLGAFAATPLGALALALSAIVVGLITTQDHVVSLGDTTATIGEIVRATFSIVIDVFNGMVEAARVLVDRWQLIAPAIGDIFKRAMNIAGQAVVDGLNFITVQLNDLGAYAGLEPIKLIEFKPFEVGSSAEELGEEIKAGFVRGFGDDPTKDIIKQLQERIRDQRLASTEDAARLAAEERAALEKQLAGSGAPPLPGKPKKEKRDTELSDINSLIRQLDPVFDAQKTLEESEKLLTRAVERRLIPQERANDLMSRQREILRDQLDPFAAVNKEIEDQRKLIGMTSEQQEVYNRLKEIEQDLFASGQSLTAQEKSDLSSKITQLVELNKQQEYLNQVIQASGSPQEQLALQQKAVTDAWAAGVLSAEQYRLALTYLNDQALEIDQSFSGGLVRGVKELDQEFANLSTSGQNLVVTAFSGAEDAILDFVKTGTTSIRELATNIIDEITRIAIRAAILRPLLNLFGGALGGTAGATAGAGAGGITADFLASANGNVFDIFGHATRYAKGGVVGNTTMFAHRGGLGVMGEAGPEAVMPLRRDGQGRLGVIAPGGGGSTQFNQTINISVEGGSSTGGEEQATRIGQEVKRQTESLFQEFVRKQQRPGGSLGRSYG